MKGANNHADDIDQRRRESIERVLMATRKLAKALISQQYGCSFDCSCKLLGALVKAMDALGFVFSQPAAPFIGFNFAATLEYFRQVRSPGSCRNEKSYSYQSSRDCSLELCMGLAIDGLEEHVAGLSLQEYLPVS